MSFQVVVLTSLATLLSLTTWAAPNCTDVEDNVERRECFESQLQDAAGLMQSELKSAQSRLEDFFRDEPEEKQEALQGLLMAQGSWTVYAHRECSIQSVGALHGSSQGAKLVSCLIEMTEQRTKALRTIGRFEFEN